MCLFRLNHFICFRTFFSSHYPPSFCVASSLSVFDSTSSSHFHPCVFFHPRLLCSTTSVVPSRCLFSSSSTAAMTSLSKTNVKSTSSQTNNTITSYNAHSLKAAIFKTLALKIGNELNIGTIAHSTRRAFFKIMYNIFLLSSKKIPFVQYYRLHISGHTIAICETQSSNVFVLAQKSFDQNQFYFLHAVQEAVDAFKAVLHDFGFFQKPAPDQTSSSANVFYSI